MLATSWSTAREKTARTRLVLEELLLKDEADDLEEVGALQNDSLGE